MWYKGNQAFVGPTDEEPWSTSLPIPLIHLKRVRYRHDAELRKIDGITSIGIGEKGILVGILPEKKANRSFIPAALESIPVVVEESGQPIMLNHEFTKYRPVPAGAGVCSTLSNDCGTVGPHVSRDVPDIGVCCQLYTLTAGHVIQDMSSPPAGGRIIQQGGEPYGFFGWMFQLRLCAAQQYHLCVAVATPVNDTRWTPDVAAIGHDTFDQYPMAPPCNGAQKPVRRMQYGKSAYVDGPTGIVRIPTMSSCSGNCLRTWGIYAHRASGKLRSTEVYDAIWDLKRNKVFYQGPFDSYTSTVSLQPGDSGALVAWDNSRDVIGLTNASVYFNSNPPVFLYGYYQRLDYIQLAFSRAGVSYDHYWGTGNGKLNPSYLITDPLFPNPPCSQ